MVNKKIQFETHQRATSPLFNNFSEQVWEDLASLGKTIFSDGFYDEEQFPISLTIQSPISYVTVGPGVGYQQGHRLVISPNDTKQYNATAPLDPLPQSTGCAQIPLENPGTYWLWIRYVRVVDLNTTGVTKNNALVYYKWVDGYDIQVTTSEIPPAAGTGFPYMFLTKITLPTPGYDNTGRQLMVIPLTTSGSIDFKSSCRVASTVADGNIALSGATPLIIDGVTVTNGDRILLKNQGGVLSHKDNGIYTVTITGATYTLTRASDADTSEQVTAGMYTYISEGTLNHDTGWVLTTKDPIVLGTTPLTFERFNYINGVTSTGTPVANQVTYWASCNSITGNSNFQWNPSTSTLSVNGSACALCVVTPTIYNTGDILLNSNAGASFARLATTGLGLGVTPATHLHVAGTGSERIRVQSTGGACLDIGTDYGAGVLGTITDHPLTISTNNTPRLSISTSGLVGINCASPNCYLDVNGNSRVTGCLTVSSQICAGTSVTSPLFAAPAGTNLCFTTSASCGMLFNTTICKGSYTLKGGMYITSIAGENCSGTLSGSGTLLVGENISGASCNSLSAGIANTLGTGQLHFAFGCRNSIANNVIGGYAFGVCNTISNNGSMVFGCCGTVTGTRSMLFNVDAISRTLANNDVIALMGGWVGIGTLTPTTDLHVQGCTRTSKLYTNELNACTGSTIMIGLGSYIGNAKCIVTCGADCGVVFKDISAPIGPFGVEIQYQWYQGMAWQTLPLIRAQAEGSEGACDRVGVFGNAVKTNPFTSVLVVCNQKKRQYQVPHWVYFGGACCASGFALACRDWYFTELACTNKLNFAIGHGFNNGTIYYPFAIEENIQTNDLLKLQTGCVSINGLAAYTTCPTLTDDKQLVYKKYVDILGSTYANCFKFNEFPQGLCNGSNVVYCVSFVYVTCSTRVFLNGLRMALNHDYNENPGTCCITFCNPPLNGDHIVVDYIKV